MMLNTYTLSWTQTGHGAGAQLVQLGVAMRGRHCLNTCPNTQGFDFEICGGGIHCSGRSYYGGDRLDTVGVGQGFPVTASSLVGSSAACQCGLFDG